MIIRCSRNSSASASGRSHPTASWRHCSRHRWSIILKVHRIHSCHLDFVTSFLPSLLPSFISFSFIRANTIYFFHPHVARGFQHAQQGRYWSNHATASSSSSFLPFGMLHFSLSVTSLYSSSGSFYLPCILFTSYNLLVHSPSLFDRLCYSSCTTTGRLFTSPVWLFTSHEWDAPCEQQSHIQIIRSVKHSSFDGMASTFSLISRARPWPTQSFWLF